MRLPVEFQEVDDIPIDYEPAPIGDWSGLVALLQDLFPGARLDSWGNVVVDGQGYSIEIGVGRREEQEVTMISFQVRGSGDEVVNRIADALDHLGLRAIETGSGGFFDRDSAMQAFGQWQRYRDHVVDRD